jgi:xanthine dehydrogenase iron-sulfur cluster and FAD-binding subunit A
VKEHNVDGMRRTWNGWKRTTQKMVITRAEAVTVKRASNTEAPLGQLRQRLHHALVYTKKKSYMPVSSSQSKVYVPRTGDPMHDIKQQVKIA